MDAMDTRNKYSNFVVNKYLHAVVSCWLLLTYCHKKSLRDCLKPVLIWPRWRKDVAQLLWPVPEAAVTVLCTPDDGCDGHPKHVE